VSSVELAEAVEVQRQGAECPVLVTCEHASERLPPGWTWPDADAWLAGTHWAFDVGAADLARELAVAWRTTAVLSRFSRLLVDPNRETDAADLIRREAEGRPVVLNRDIDAAERERRLALLWRPYHDTIGRELRRQSVEIVLAIHTFTPVWEGRTREVEVGVLFDLEEALAERAAKAVEQAGFVTRLNEPYSGKAGLIFSAHHHASAHGLKALEIELRQDLAVQPDVRRRLAVTLGSVLNAPTSGSLR